MAAGSRAGRPEVLRHAKVVTARNSSASPRHTDCAISSPERVLEIRGREEVGHHPCHDEHAPRRTHGVLIDPQFAHPGAAGALGEFQEIGMIDDAAHVGILVMNFDGVAMGHGLPPVPAACLARSQPEPARARTRAAFAACGGLQRFGAPALGAGPVRGTGRAGRARRSACPAGARHRQIAGDRAA
jgi:hypothetical protein